MTLPLSRTSALAAPLLRALGELYVSATDLSDLVRGSSLLDAPARQVDEWRASAVVALDDATRIARSAAIDVRSPDVILVRCRDGSAAAVGHAAVTKTARRLSMVARTGRAIGMRSRYAGAEARAR